MRDWEKEGCWIVVGWVGEGLVGAGRKGSRIGVGKLVEFSF